MVVLCGFGYVYICCAFDLGFCLLLDCCFVLDVICVMYGLGLWCFVGFVFKFV